MREQRGIKAAWVAKRLGLKHRQQVNKLESKKDVSVDEFIAYVKALDMKPGDLLENSVGIITAEDQQILEVLRSLTPAVRKRTLRIVVEVAGIQEDSHQPPQPVERAPERPDKTKGESPTLPVGGGAVSEFRVRR